jgi:hypothetical protein
MAAGDGDIDHGIPDAGLVIYGQQISILTSR